jgi:hypothetical protein
MQYMTDSDVDAPLVLRNPAAPPAEDASARREAPPYRVGVDMPVRMYTACGATVIAAKPVRVLWALRLSSGSRVSRGVRRPAECLTTA